MSRDPWGELGNPPQWVLEGPPQLVEKYRSFVAEALLIKRAPARARVVRMAELRARFQREFPREKPVD